MRKPNGGNGWLDRAARQIDGFYNLWFVQYLFAPLLVSVLPLIVLGYYGSDLYRQWIDNNLGRTGRWLRDATGFVFIFFSFYPYLLLLFGRAIRSRVQSKGIEVDGLLALTSALDSIVGRKSQLYANALTKKEIKISDLIDPKVQIAEIVRSICDFFNATLPDGKRRNLIRVSLAVVDQGKIAGVPVYYPNDEPIRSSLESLNKPQSGFMTALKLRRIHIVPSIQKELKRKDGKDGFVDTGVSDDNVGSLICYPVNLKYSNEIPYVISIHVDEENYFKREKAQMYEHCLGRFALRLGLEYSVLSLKEKSDDPTK